MDQGLDYYGEGFTSKITAVESTRRDWASRTLIVNCRRAPGRTPLAKSAKSDLAFDRLEVGKFKALPVNQDFVALLSIEVEFRHLDPT
ncbi:hypothetical protein [Mesorhizobium sp.]|uniref:hypothetical protein n=1 Tax=Mesorhizobium sp. TaxID=1871066 RepID=UPI0025BD9EA3|nr:hypothetical protein [Mesorhizobium sp.]